MSSFAVLGRGPPGTTWHKESRVVSAALSLTVQEAGAVSGYVGGDTGSIHAVDAMMYVDDQIVLTAPVDGSDIKIIAHNATVGSTTGGTYAASTAHDGNGNPIRVQIDQLIASVSLPPMHQEVTGEVYVGGFPVVYHGMLSLNGSSAYGSAFLTAGHLDIDLMACSVGAVSGDLYDVKITSFTFEPYVTMEE